MLSFGRDLKTRHLVLPFRWRQYPIIIINLSLEVMLVISSLFKLAKQQIKHGGFSSLQPSLKSLTGAQHTNTHQAHSSGSTARFLQSSPFMWQGTPHICLIQSTGAEMNPFLECQSYFPGPNNWMLDLPWVLECGAGTSACLVSRRDFPESTFSCDIHDHETRQLQTSCMEYRIVWPVPQELLGGGLQWDHSLLQSLPGFHSCGYCFVQSSDRL